MEPARRRSHIFLRAAQFLAMMGLISKIAIDFSKGNFQWVYLALLIVVGAAQLVLTYLMIRRGAVMLVKGSRKFSKYFVDWYQRDGEHFIFCRDLDWLKGNEEASIVNAIANRGRKMTICTLDTTSQLADRLRRAEVSIYPVPAQTATCAVMSLHKVDGKRTLIVRHKHGAADNSHFIETSNNVVTALAEDLFQQVINSTSAPPTLAP